MKRALVPCLLVAGLVAAGAAYGGRTSPAPAPDSLKVARAHQTVSLPGLLSDRSRTTDLTLVNLAGSAATCTVRLMGTDGTAVAEASTFSLKPRSQRDLADVFSQVGAAGVREAAAAVSCDQPFYAYARITDGATGRVAVATPVDAGAAALSKRGNAGPRVCGTGYCFESKGVVHKPTPAQPVKRLAYGVPAGTWGRVTMSLDVTVGPWYAPDPDGKHLIYWFVVNRNVDMLGMLYFRGPDSSTALARYGIHLTHPQKIKLVKGFKAIPGHTYHCENDLDMAGGTFTITITDKGTGEVTTLKGAPNVTSLTTRQGDKLFIDMAFPEGKVPDEVPGFGWTYANVQIQTYALQ
ncbi:MAG: hypothetical protein QOF89_6166 [Acidobacteriota bacterium]|jgi:hypothetical protein|nr:hypothetical protein [Acidobacteriota bacterium]